MYYLNLAYRNTASVQIACRIWRLRMLREQNICVMMAFFISTVFQERMETGWSFRTPTYQGLHGPAELTSPASSISGPMPNLHSNPKTRWSEWMFRFAKHCFKRNHMSFTISWEISVALVIVRLRFCVLLNATHLYELDLGGILTLVCHLFCIWCDTFMGDIKVDIYGGASMQLGLRAIDRVQPHCLTISYFVFALHYSYSKQNELPNVIKKKMCRL